MFEGLGLGLFLTALFRVLAHIPMKVLVSLSSSSLANGRSRLLQVPLSTRLLPLLGWPSVSAPASPPYVYSFRHFKESLIMSFGQSMTSANASIAAGVLDSISAGILIYT